MSYIGNTPTLGYFPTDTFTSVGGSTYSLSQSPSTASAIEVSVQGVTQAVSAYSVSGTTLTLAGVATDDVIFVRHLGETLLVPIVVDDTITTAKIVNDAVTTIKIVDDAVTEAKIVNDAVTTIKIVDDAVTEAKIVNNAVTLAKMAGNTDGKIITFDASGDPVAVGPGTDGQVLTSTGAGSPPAFEANPSGSTTVSGTVELLTNAEAITGSDTTRAMTATAMRAGLVDGNDTVLGKFNLKDTSYITVAHGDTSGADVAMDMTAGQHHSITISTNAVAISVTNATGADELQCGVLHLTNGGSQTVTFTAGDFAGGTAPSLTTSGLDVLAFWTYDGGTIIHWSVINLDSKSP